MLPRFVPSILFALLFLSAPALAGVIVGRVVDPNGVGVANVNIGADFSSGGGNPTVANGGTDVNGFFSTTITPNGVFDITFTPPAPPTTSLLVRDLFNVSVVGTIDLGTIVLPAGNALTGRVVNPFGGGVADVNLDVLDAAGNLLTLPHDTTDASGNFALAVPSGSLTMRFDTTPVVGQTLAPKQMALSVGGNMALGDVALAPGYLLSGFVRRTNLTGVLDVDLDVYDAASGTKLYTPNDNSLSNGSFLVILPAGTFDVKFCPPFAALLVARELPAVSIAGNTNLGDVILQPGVMLSGTVQAFNGLKYAGVDVDLKNSATGAPVVLCDDNTSATGTYQIVVPTGTFDVRFTPPYALPLASQIVPAVTISANKVQNGTLPSCPFFTNSGSGTAGTGGVVPQLTASGGAPRLGNPDYALVVSNGRGGASAVVVWSPSVYVVGPFPSGAVLTANGGYRSITLSGPSGVAGAGSGVVALPIGSQPFFSGTVLQARAYVIDRGSVSGRAFTPYLNATLQL